MQLKYCNRTVLAKQAAIFVLSTALLFFGFFSNSWNVLMISEEQWVDSQRDGEESWVVGRMVKSRQDGIFSSGGLLGLGSPDGEAIDWFTEYGKYQVRQYTAYINDLKFTSYTTYNSLIGGQGILFSLLDRLLPISPQEKLRLFNLFQSLLLAVAIAFIILWFYLEFGMCTALFVMTTAALSHWLVFYGQNIYWSVWAFYIPIILAMYFLRQNRTDARHDEIKCGALVFSAVFVKCLLNGYEFITTTLVMMMVPFVYYYVRGAINTRKLLRYTLIAVFCSGLAIFISFTMLSFQIASVKGNLLDGIQYIVDTFQRRTYADPHDFSPIYAQSLEASATDVVMIYLKSKFCDLNNYFSTSIPFVSRKLFIIRYWYLIILFLISSIVLYFHRNRYVSMSERQSSLALISATWVSILAPLSWYIIFKSQSFVQEEQNAMIWQMPFTFFGFAVFGLAVSSIFRDILRLTKSST